MQLAMFEQAVPSFDSTFRTLVHHDLGRGAWVEHARSWMRGEAPLFAAVRDAMAWTQSRVKMYDRVVDVPRLLAKPGADGPLHPVLQHASMHLSSRYAVRLDRVMMALYRDGRDSVAMHADRLESRPPAAVVAILSLGGPRRFLMRPRGGGPSRRFVLASGDLLVMGGTCQETWEHGVPKAASARPRIAVMFRHDPLPPGSAAEVTAQVSSGTMH